jgi:hypothetical protein
MNYVLQQIAYASVVSPQGDIAPAWQAFVQATVDREALSEWGQRAFDPALPIILSEKPKREPLLKILAGILP